MLKRSLMRRNISLAFPDRFAANLTLRPFN